MLYEITEIYVFQKYDNWLSVFSKSFYQAETAYFWRVLLYIHLSNTSRIRVTNFFFPSYIELPNNDLTLEDTFEVGDDYLEDKLDEGIEDEDEETEEDDKIFGFIPNPLTPVFKLQKDIQSNVDSLLSKIPIIGWNTNVYISILVKNKIKISI